MAQYYFYATVCCDAFDYEPTEVIVEFDIQDNEILFCCVIYARTGEHVKGDIEFCLNPDDFACEYKYTKDIESFIELNRKNWKE